MVALLGAALLLPRVACADDRSACFDAAENAQRLRRESKLAQARSELLTCSRDVCPGPVRRDCTGWLAELAASQPTVVVAVRDAKGRDITDVKVTVDGKPFLTRLQGAAVPIDPGEHQFRFELGDGQSSSEKILIVVGERDRVLRVEVKPPAKRATGAPPPPLASSSSSWKGPGPGPWIASGIGVATLAGFGILQGIAQSKHAALASGCGTTHSCDPGDVSSLRTQFVASGVLLGVGGAALLTGVTWLLIAPGKPAAAPGLALDIQPQAGGAVVTFARGF